MVTVSLETSKSLVANGIVVESYFYWTKTKTGAELCHPIHGSQTLPIHAPTAGEILEYLMSKRARVSVSLGRGEYYVDVFTDDLYFSPYRFTNDNLEEPLADALLKLKELKVI